MANGDGRTTLAALARAVPDAVAPPGADRVRVRGIASESGAVEPGDVFVAVPGTAADGHDFIAEAAAHGAAAVVAERSPDDAALPVVGVPDARAAAAELAAWWHGRPAERLPLVGITGSLGKTSVLSMLQAILSACGLRAGVIGSLGARLGEWERRTRLTTPPPLALHELLREMADRRADLAAMEVTSHALVQRRTEGLAFVLGIFTNLVLLEHLAYHGSFRRYVEAKTRFFRHLRPDAPLIYPAGDRVVGALVEQRSDITPVSCGAEGRVAVRVDRRTLDPGGTDLVLTLRRPLPRLSPDVGEAASPPDTDGCVPPLVFPLSLRLLGRPNVTNATIAATAALCLGAPVEAVQDALAAFPPPRRRMQLIHRGRFTVLDDTVGHPDSITGVFEVAERLPHERLHIVYAVRGRRGAEINRRDAEALAIWAGSLAPATVVVTSSEEATDDANRVEPDERDAFLGTLERYGVPFDYRPRLNAAVCRTLERVRRGDLVLLLGAQGMNGGAEIVERWVG